MRYSLTAMLLVSLLFFGCAGSKIFTFQNAPGRVQIPDDWIDATTPGKSKATSPDGKSWVALARLNKPSEPADFKQMAALVWESQQLGKANFEGITVNGRGGALGTVADNGKVTVVCVCEGKLPNQLLLVIATGEAGTEKTLRGIVTSYKEE